MYEIKEKLEQWSRSINFHRIKRNYVKTSSTIAPKKIKQEKPILYKRNKSPVKSLNDKREYCAIQLNNGLEALLISDLPLLKEGEDIEEEDVESKEIQGDVFQKDACTCIPKTYKVVHLKDSIAAVSLCIGIGSVNEPEEIPGLAHLLEHLLFLGSANYPEENSFDAFLSKYGGITNASTDYEATIYHFDVQVIRLKEALERFVNCLVSPLLRKECLDREIESVDSEFQSSKQDDSCRKQQLLGTLTVKGHPLRKFFWGNLKTLKEIPNNKRIDVIKKLREFHSRNYSAHYMTLTIEAMLTLDKLEEWVAEIFNQIPNNGLPKTNVWTNKEVFKQKSFLKIYKVVPVQHVHQLNITWVLPSLKSCYRSNPHYYLSFLISHEGPGSLLSYLKKKLWALSLWSGNDDNGLEYNSFFTLFTLTLTLTDEGYYHLFNVMQAIFQYIKMLKDVGPIKRIFDEIKIIEENGFHWQEQINITDYVEILCEKMQYFSSEDYLTGNILLYEFDENIIIECLEAMTFDKAIILLLSKNHEKEGICNQTEQWFGVSYGRYDFEPNWIIELNNISSNSYFSIPESNPYIASNFEIKSKDLDISPLPKLIMSTDQTKLWYKKDDNFLVPRGYVYFYLITPLTCQSIQNCVLFDFMIQIIEFNLQEDAYNAKIAQLFYELSAEESGLEIIVNGFNDKLFLLFQNIIKHISYFDVSDKIFDALKSNLLQIYHNIFIQPDNLAKEIYQSLIKMIHFSVIDKRAALQKITKNMVLSYAEQFKSTLYLEGLIQGNITAEEALKYEQYLCSEIKCSVLPKSWHPISRILKLPHDERYCRIKNLNKNDSISLVYNYYQVGQITIKKWCLIELIISLIEEPCFAILRTQEQLGYDIGCGCTYNGGIIGFYIYVQTEATKYSVCHIDDRIDNFLNEMRKRLKKLPKEVFFYHLKSIISYKNSEDPILEDEVDRNWTEIIQQEYVFDRQDKEIECLKKIKLRDLKRWFNQFLKNKKYYKKLSIQIVGTGKYDTILSKKKNNLLAKKTSNSLKLKLATRPNMAKLSDYLEHILEARLAQLKSMPNQTYEYIFLPLEEADEELSIYDIVQFKSNLAAFPVTKMPL